VSERLLSRRCVNFRLHRTGGLGAAPVRTRKLTHRRESNRSLTSSSKKRRVHWVPGVGAEGGAPRNRRCTAIRHRTCCENRGKSLRVRKSSAPYFGPSDQTRSHV